MVGKIVEDGDYYFRSDNAVFPYDIVNYIYSITKVGNPFFKIDIGLPHKDTYDYNEPFPIINFISFEEMENKIKHYTKWKDTHSRI